MSEARCDPSLRVCVEKAREFCPVETGTLCRCGGASSCRGTTRAGTLQEVVERHGLGR